MKNKKIERRKRKGSNNMQIQRCQNWVPGGEIVLSSTDGIVISMIGLLDGKPLTAS